MSAPPRSRPVRTILCAAALAGPLLVHSGGASAWLGGLWPAEPEPEVRWGYSGDVGPQRWGDLSRAFAACQRGTAQSPIDLGGAAPVGYAPLSFRYRSQPLSVVHDGTTIRVDAAFGSYLSAGGRDYELRELRFHVPAEHLIRGVRPDMEMQLLHRDAQGGTLMVAVLFKAGRRMYTHLTRIWDALPAAPGMRFYDRQQGINLTFLLPQDRSYYTYHGSLTHPPCTEGVEWVVLAEPVDIDGSYIHRLSRLLGNNARPAQPLNGRRVFAVSRR